MVMGTVSRSGLAGLLGDSDHFGRALTALGDLDGDGVQDLAVGAYQDDGGGSNPGVFSTRQIAAS